MAATVVVASPSQLQHDLTAAIASHRTSFSIPSGEYVFGATSFNITGAKDMTITVEPPVTFWFDVGGGVKFEGCSNVTFQGNGMVVDYDPLPYLQFSAVNDSSPPFGSKHEWVVQVKLDAGSPDPAMFLSRWAPPPVSRNEFIQGPLWYSGANGTTFPLKLNTWMGWNTLKPTSTPGVYVYKGSGSPAPEKGDKGAVIIRVGYTWLVKSSSHVVSQNVSIFASSFMAITEFDGEGANVYDGMKVVRRPAPSGSDASCGPHANRTCLGVMASNADVIHSSSCQHGPTVQNGEFGFAADDYFNVHTRGQLSAGVVGGSRFLVLDPRLVRDHLVPDDYPYGTAQTFQHVVPGWGLTFHNATTLEPIARVTVATVSRVPASDNATLTQAAFTCANINSLMDNVNPGFMPLEIEGAGTPPRVWWVTVREPLSSLPEFVRSNATVLSVDNWRNDNARVVNNLFHGGNDGIRWKSSNGVFAGNVWLNALSNPRTGLEVTPLRSYLEGPFVISNVTIANNVFEGVPNGPNGGLIRQCKGMEGRAAFTTCTDVVVENNTWSP